MANLSVDTVNVRDENNRTPLHINVFLHKLEVVKNLLQNGADPSLTSNKGNTPLHTAASRKYHRLIETLLKYSSRDKVKEFIDVKTTESGSTALHVAASNGCLTSVRHLLSYGANFEVINKQGQRPVDVTSNEKVKKLLDDVEDDMNLATHGKYKKLQIRLYDVYSKDDLKASVYARNNEGMTSLQMALINNHCNTVYRIVETRVDRLFKANLYIANETAASADEFIEHGRAISARHSALMMHAEDVNVIGAKGMTEEVAVMLAEAHNIVKIAEKSFKPANGEPYEQSNILTVVEEALEALQFKPEHVTYNEAGKVIFRGHKARYYKMLRGNGSDEDEDYDDFLYEEKIVSSCMGILQVSISRAIAMFMRPIFMMRISIAAEENDLEMFNKCIDEYFIDVNMTGSDRRTTMQYAAENGNIEMVKILLRKHAILTAQTQSNKETALHLAANKGHVEVIRLLLQNIKEMSKTFVDMKTINEGWTAVHFAAKNGRLDVLKCLLEFGATYDLQDKNGKTPLDLSENKLVTAFLENIAELFQMAENGDTSLLEKFRAIQRDELVAIGNACNNSGYTIAIVAEMKGNNRAIASQISMMVKNATPDVPKIEGKNLYEDHEIAGYRLLKTLSISST